MSEEDIKNYPNTGFSFKELEKNIIDFEINFLSESAPVSDIDKAVINKRINDLKNEASVMERKQQIHNIDFGGIIKKPETVVEEPRKVIVKKTTSSNITTKDIVEDSVPVKADITGDCLYCNKSGRTKEDAFHCKHCGRSYKELTGEQDMMKIAGNFGIYIPKIYRDEKSVWKLEREIDILNDIVKGGIITYHRNWLEDLNTVFTKIKMRDLLGGQVIISTDRLFDSCLYRWLYTAMAICIQEGYSVSQLINVSIIDLKTRGNFEDLYTDVLFLELTTYNLNESMCKLDEICSIRRARDLPTFIITKIKEKSLNETEVPIICKDGVIRIIKNY